MPVIPFLIPIHRPSLHTSVRLLYNILGIRHRLDTFTRKKESYFAVWLPASIHGDLVYSAFVDLYTGTFFGCITPPIGFLVSQRRMAALKGTRYRSRRWGSIMMEVWVRQPVSRIWGRLKS